MAEQDKAQGGAVVPGRDARSGPLIANYHAAENRVPEQD